MSVVSQCKLVSSWELRKQRSVLLHGPCDSQLLMSCHKDDCMMQPIYQWYAHALFSLKFLMAVVQMDPLNVPAKFEVRSFTRFLGKLQSREGGHSGSRMVLSKRALVSSYRPYIVTFPLSLRVSEILPLLSSSTPLFPTPPLACSEWISLCFPGSGWMAFGLQRAKMLG